jgi:hypothetical protein
VTSPVVAPFDCLYVASATEVTLGRCLRGDFHLLAYVAANLAASKGFDWQYEFVGTASGIPFSSAIDDTLRDLVTNGLLELAFTQYSLSEGGRAALLELNGIESLSSRTVFLKNSCDLLLLRRPSEIEDAVRALPSAKSVLNLASSRQLLPGLDSELASAQLREMSALVSGSSESLSMASLWIDYLRLGASNEYQ